MKRKMNKKQYGFSLVELLTTLAVVAILLGLLIPALNQVSKYAAHVRQKAQFHAIGMALEAFRNDYGDYPPSSWDTATYGYYSASQRLAEALVGRDGLGFHQSSSFRSDGTDGTNPLYYPDFETYLTSLSLTAAQEDAARSANLAARKGPYLELESANAVRLGALYNNAIPGGNIVDSLVLVDMYKISKNIDTLETVGTPILYYRANKLKIGHGYMSAAPNNAGNSTYNVNDSIGGSFDGLASLTAIIGGNHPLRSNGGSFYAATANPNFTSPQRPYRSESFILQSAGPDGLYGTTDDVFNFESEK